MGGDVDRRAASRVFLEGRRKRRSVAAANRRRRLEGEQVVTLAGEGEATVFGAECGVVVILVRVRRVRKLTKGVSRGWGKMKKGKCGRMT